MNDDNEEIVEKKEVVKKNKVKDEKEVIDYYSVDIKGEVMLPGIYSMKSNSRVIDVIEEAGGLTENADTTVINLSKKIKDEMVIIVYSKEQVLNFAETKKEEEYLQNKCIQVDENSLVNDACINSDNSNSVSSGKININKASKDELMTLNGIGEAKARDIISYREKNGNFKTIEEIKNVPGIGESIYASIKENITV